MRPERAAWRLVLLALVLLLPALLAGCATAPPPTPATQDPGRPGFQVPTPSPSLSSGLHPPMPTPASSSPPAPTPPSPTPPPAQRRDVEKVGALPVPVAFASVARVGAFFYVFGGMAPGGAEDRIQRFDPSDGTFQEMGARLPTARYDMAAATDGTHVYLFGGWDGERLDQVLRYTPETDRLVVMAAQLPVARYGSAAVHDGRAIYVLGGYVGLSGAGGVRDVLRYDLDADNLTTLPVRLPSGRGGMGALWDGARVVAFGGCDDGCRVTFDEVWRYDPANGTAAVSGRLPSTRGGIAATWDGARGHLYGGGRFAAPVDQVLVYDPGDGKVSVDAARLPVAVKDAGAAFGAGASYVFGGIDGRDILPTVVRQRA